jgi:anti-sigma factor ChrR (cupin superfamily)
MNHDLDHLPADWAARLAAALEPIQPEPSRAVNLRACILKRAQAPKPVDPHLTLSPHERRWHNLAPGIDLQMLRRASDTASYLLRMAAGMSVPAHDHATDEECLVLEGDVWLGDTHAFAGDYHFARRGIPHGVIHTDTGCLLFLNGPKPEAAAHYA